MPPEMIPVRVADDDVRDFFGLHSRELDGFVTRRMYPVDGKYLRKVSRW